VNNRYLNLFLKIFVYIFGIFVLSFAAVLIIRSGFGSGGWDAFNVNVSLLTNGKITVGMSSMMVGLTFLIIVLSFRRKLKYLFSLFPILFTGSFIDLWNLVLLKNFNPTNVYLKTLIFIIALFLLPLGLTILIKTNLSPMVYDEFTFILMDVFKSNSFAKVRIAFEAFAILMAIFIGLLHNGKFNEVSVGTFILSFLLGPIISMWSNILDKFIIKLNIEKSLD